MGDVDYTNSALSLTLDHSWRSDQVLTSLHRPHV
jgi:hypothetical protein